MSDPGPIYIDMDKRALCKSKSDLHQQVRIPASMFRPVRPARDGEPWLYCGGKKFFTEEEARQAYYKIKEEQ